MIGLKTCPSGGKTGISVSGPRCLKSLCFVDTHYPCYHIYREKDLEGVEAYKSTYSQHAELGGHSGVPPARAARARGTLTLSMVVKNEENRYLKRVLEAHRDYITHAVIIDDGSTDHTAELCRSLLQGIPLHLVQNSVSHFSNEVELRSSHYL